MIEFLTNYGLWIVLAGVFFAMHRFGMGCCGGSHRHGPDKPRQDVAEGQPRAGKTSENGLGSEPRCH